jgi:hypothetical protein
MFYAVNSDKTYTSCNEIDQCIYTIFVPKFTHDDVPKRQANVSATLAPIKTETLTINAVSYVGTTSNGTIARPNYLRKKT